MDTIALLGSALGLSFVAGMRLYATVLAVGLGVRYGFLHLHQSLQGLDVLAHPAVLITAGIAFLAEFVSDKIPWFDSLWDSVHTFIRPVGAAFLGLAALGDLDPVMRTLMVIACGGVALTSHSTKAATRVAVNHSPEPFSNMALSLAGDVAAPVGVWMSLNHPLIMLGLVLAALVIFAILARWIWKKFRSVLARIGLIPPANTASLDRAKSESH
jgi:hypothetical protein